MIPGLPGRCLFTIFLISGLVRAPAALAEITLPQANGETLTLAAPAESIITLAPNLAELVYAAGAGGRLLAVVEYSHFPPPVRKLARVGNAFRIDLERIVDLKPDLVIGWKSGNPQPALKKLQDLGIRVWQVEITRPEEIADSVEQIARAAATEAEGRAAALELRRRLEELKSRNAGKSSVDYFFQIAHRPIYTVNGRHIISRSLAICGGHNVFSELPALAPQISRESVILADPQIMIAPSVPDEPSALDTWKSWPQLRAVAGDNLYYLPADEISQATPRLLDSIEKACGFLDKVRGQTLKVE